MIKITLECSTPEQAVAAINAIANVGGAPAVQVAAPAPAVTAPAYAAPTPPPAATAPAAPAAVAPVVAAPAPAAPAASGVTAAQVAAAAQAFAKKFGAQEAKNRLALLGVTGVGQIPTEGLPHALTMFNLV